MEEIESGLVKKVSCAAKSDEPLRGSEPNDQAFSNERGKLGLMRPTAATGDPPIAEICLITINVSGNKSVFCCTRH